MDFIEKYLGLSPDGGDGSMEIMVLVLLVALGALIGYFCRSPQNRGLFAAMKPTARRLANVTFVD